MKRNRFDVKLDLIFVRRVAALVGSIVALAVGKDVAAIVILLTGIYAEFW